MNGKPSDELVRQLRFLSKDYRDARTASLEPIQLNELHSRFSNILFQAFQTQLLPEPIIEAIMEQKKTITTCAYDHSFVVPFVGYCWLQKEIKVTESYTMDWGQDTEVIPERKSLVLNAGFVSLVWPELFRPIFGPTIESGDEIGVVLHETIEDKSFTIVGYHLTACELLAEWIESNTADCAGDRLLAGDGLKVDTMMFVWGGQSFVNLTPSMLPILNVLAKAYRDDRQAGLPEFEAALKKPILDGFGRIFDVGRYPNRTKHAVWNIITGGPKNYSLIDPLQIK